MQKTKLNDMRRSSFDIYGKPISILASLLLLAICASMMYIGKYEASIWAATISGIMSYFTLRPGKKSIKMDIGGVVVAVESDDTGVIRTGVAAVATSITNEISERTVQKAISASESIPPPIPNKEIK